MSEPQTFLLAPGREVPNHPTYPLLAYPGAFPETVSASEIQARFRSHEWGKSWINGVFSYHHFHSNAHEVLGCFAGEAQVQFGGDGGPVVPIRAGDVVIIPAGVGHKNLGASDDFGVVGAYPPGESHDVCSGGEEAMESLLPRVARVPLPPADPVYGKDGPLFEHWN